MHAMGFVHAQPGPCACVARSTGTADVRTQHRSLGREVDFMEPPSQEFFCPVSLQLLLEPQQTSCCGHHLSLEAATRLQREGKPCPMCNGEGWTSTLDKYHRRKVHQVWVRCWHKENGCEWVGEVKELKRHADSCVKRLWECQYCALTFMYGEGKGKHWPTCPKFPEPCPNSCEVGSVERCNIEQHCSVCSLEPVACEMKEFGCSVVVPRKELATHMRESELQHLTVMTMLNLRLSRQLQQDSTERDRKITQLQQEMTKLQIEMQEEMQLKMDELQTKIDEMQTEQKREFSDRIQKIERTVYHIEQHTRGTCPGCEIITFTQYSRSKGSGLRVTSDPFYSHHHGYKFKLEILYYCSALGVFLSLMEGEYDDQLCWPIEVKVHLELLNQAGDHRNVARTKNSKWKLKERDQEWTIDNNLISYPNLERVKGDVQYVMNDCIKFRIFISLL